MKNNTFINKATAIVLMITLIMGISGCSKVNEATNRNDTSDSNIVSEPDDTPVSEHDDTLTIIHEYYYTDDTPDTDTNSEIEEDPIDIPDPGDYHEIEFKITFAGFTPVSVDDKDAYAAFCRIAEHYKIILTDDDWHDFSSKYCPGIRCYEYWDFASECIIVCMSHPSLPSCTSNSPVLSVQANNNYVYVEPNNDYSTYFTVLNHYPTCNFALDIIIINKSDLPKNLPEYIIYKAE